MKSLISLAFVSLAYNFLINNMENTTYPVKLINVSINKPADQVYKFASNPENFPKWVAFVKSIKKDGEYWVGETTIGKLRIQFTPQNEFGIIDHHVTMENGDKVFNPMRVLSNNDGCEFIFTLFRMPGRSDKEFNEDAASVTKDLNKLKQVMESN
jgi:hypothetical protein